MTHGWIAPEMWRPEDVTTGPVSGSILPDAVLRGSWTNVWQIGRVIQQMMELELIPEDIKYHSDLSEQDMEPVIHKDEDVGDFPEKHYSEVLREVVRRCLRFRPEDRPTPQDVIHYISRFGPENCQGMDTFGSDQWMEVIQGEIDEAVGDEQPTQAEQEVLSANIELARPYLRAWIAQKASRFIDLAHFPNSDMLLERVDKCWWITEPHEKMIDVNGKPLRQLPYEWCSWENRNVQVGHDCRVAANHARQALGGPPDPGPPRFASRAVPLPAPAPPARGSAIPSAYESLGLPPFPPLASGSATSGGEVRNGYDAGSAAVSDLITFSDSIDDSDISMMDASRVD